MNWESVIIGAEFSASALLFFCGWFVYQFGKNDTVRKRFAILCVLLGVWIIFCGRWSEHIHAITYPALVGAFVLGAFIGSAFLSFISVFPKRLAIIQPWHLGASMAISTGFALCAFTISPDFIFATPPVVPRYFFIYSVYYVLCFIGILTLVVYQYHKLADTEKKQLFWLATGLIFAMGMAIIFSLFTLLSGTMKHTYIGSLVCGSIPLFCFAAIIRHEAFDIRTAIHYSVYWAIVSAILVIPFFILVSFATPIINLLFSAQLSPTASLILLGLPAVVAVVHYHWIQPKLNQQFFKRKFHLRDQVIVFLEAMAQINAVEPLIQMIRTLFSTVLYASSVEVIISPSPVQNTPDIRIPLIVNQTLIATIIVGTKHTLKPYSPDELKFMNRIGHQAAIFLNNAILFDSIKKKNQELIDIQATIVNTEREKTAIEQHQIHTQELARGIIHEVKNTHLAVNNFVQLILNRVIHEPSEVTKILGIIGEQSTRLHLFSKNYLHNELMKSRLYNIRYQPLRVMDLIGNAVKSNSFFVNSNKIEVETHFADDDWIFADHDKIHLVVSNLINNAAMHKKNNRLLIHGSATTTTYTLSFTSLLDRSSEDITIGLNTGLGLRVSEYVVRHHGGKMSIRTDRGQFVVTITLPNHF